MNLFDMNGPLMNALRKLANIFLCNVMFCLLSLPVITIGASLTALFTCMQAILANDEDDVIAKQFWRAFKQNFGQATMLWLFCFVIFGLLGFYYMIISHMTGMAGKLYMISFFVMCLLFLFGFQYLFPLQARYKNKVKYTIKNAWLLSIAAFPWTLLSIALVVGAVYISFFMDPSGANTAVFLWGVLGFGIVAYLNSIIFQKAFNLIDPVKLEPERHTAPEGAIFIDEEHMPDDRS
ncbi:MAG: DUF624 domain-containing protein [Lachnospiraceae bacterium]|nr:DUF624 domain-containing protein [Lachnospiraceae bacterium]MDY4968726.1 DUF624 domain-containing protein [Lachnospiraceae bacterium]